MANNRMKNVWLDKQKSEDRLKKVHSKKPHNDEKAEKPHAESSIDTSTEPKGDNS